MAIFDNNFLFESSVVEEDFMEEVQADMTVEPTMESIVEMNADFNEAGYKASSALMIADLVCEQSGQTSLLEASLNDFWEKTKDRFKKLWAKIKGFFQNLLKKMEAMFQTNDKFIKRYSSIIRKLNSNSKADYAIFVETQSTVPSNVKAAVDLISKDATSAGFASNAAGFTSMVVTMAAAVEEHAKVVVSDSDTKDAKDTVKEAEESAYESFADGATDASKAKKYFKAIYWDKLTGTKNIADKGMVADMLAYCEKWLKDGKKNVIRSQAAMDKVIKDSIKVVDKFKSSQKRAYDGNKSVMPLINEAISAMNRMIGVANYANGTSFSTFNGIFRTYCGMLKKFVSKNSKLVTDKPAKESAADVDSILDSIMASF